MVRVSTRATTWSSRRWAPSWWVRAVPGVRVELVAVEGDTEGGALAQRVAVDGARVVGALIQLAASDRSEKASSAAT
jgi:hypothetical protein